MPLPFRKLGICLVLTGIAAWAQPKPSFEVATIKPAAPLDQAKIAAALQSGGKLPVGVTINARRAEYLYLDLKALLIYAYGVKPYQITGPDWMATTRFDIVAKLPDGSTKDDGPKMLQSPGGAVQASGASQQRRTSCVGAGCRQGWSEAEGFRPTARGD